MKLINNSSWEKIQQKSSHLLFSLPLLATTLSLVLPPQIALAVDIKVGIVQRFGDEQEDEITVASNTGDSLILNFTDVNTQNTHALTAQQIVLKIASKTLAQQQIEERLILGDYGTFETAEDNAKKWQALGIEVEVTQPGRWQVWAKRSTYNSPLLKRLLLEQLQQQGYNQVYIESQTLLEIPQVSFQIGEKTYQVSYLDIKSKKGNAVRIKDDSQGKGKWRKYGGRFTIQPNAYGNYTLVNQVDIETYLRGVVPHEIGANVPIEAAKAQTIIARTYALRNTRRFQADNYEMCAKLIAKFTMV